AYEQYRTDQSPPPPLVPIEEKKAPARDYRFSLAILIPLMLLISVVLLWRHHTKVIEVARSVAVTHSNSRGVESRLLDLNGSKTKPSIENSKRTGGDGAVKKVGGDSVAGNIQKQSDSGTALKSPDSAAAPPSMRPIRVEIHANEDAWLSVIADGKTMMEGVLPA